MELTFLLLPTHDIMALTKNTLKHKEARRPPMSEQPTHLTHLDDSGNIHMVDVSDKEITKREALAKARVRMAPQTVRLIESNQVTKGNVLEIAKIAAIMA